MPVGTSANVKAVHQHELKEIVKAQIILSNTYHLYLRPGMDVLSSAGGLHSFMNWDRPILTDSGGYQVFSLAANRKIKEDGVHFQSHIDGSKLVFTPEYVMDIQRIIGADIIMAFDECTPYPCEYDYAKKSMELTHRWLARCKQQFENTGPLYTGFAEMDQTLFPIIQGSTFKDLRIQSAEYVASLDMEGNAIGGLSVGEPAEEMYAMTELVCGILPESKPRYLMGVGTPANILENIALGIDMFDCVMPTRNARNGMLFTANGIINIKNEKWKTDNSVVDPDFSPFHSKAYLRHLISSGEILGSQIATLHNLSFYLWLVTEARNCILAGTFAPWKEEMVKKTMQRL
jgi:queuine tRNA-ribosyltransferase